MIFLELIIFLSTVLPLFHILNVLFTRRRRKQAPSAAKRNKKMSILIPCYNEEDTAVMSIEGLLAMAYEDYEAVYINDGSKDGTMNVLTKALDLEAVQCAGADHPLGLKAIYRSKKHHHFFVLDKANGGKSEALNAGIQFAHADIIVTLDADSVLAPDALTLMNRAFDDENVVAAGGAIHITQGYDPQVYRRRARSRRFVLIALQVLEYLKGFYIFKLSLAKQEATAIISGAFGVFQKDILTQSGGFRKTLGEDIDMTLRIQQMIQKTQRKVVYLPSALCCTQCPESFKDLTKQRIRWHKGFMNCICYYKKFILKTFLTRSLTFHFFVEALLVGITSCLFTVCTYVFVFVAIFASPEVVSVFGIYFAFGLLFNILYAASAVAVSLKYNPYPKAMLRTLVLAVLVDILFYRYYTLFIYIRGTVAYFINKKGQHQWNKVARSKRVLAISSVLENER